MKSLLAPLLLLPLALSAEILLPDPAVLADQGRYAMVGTDDNSSKQGRFKIYTSTNLVDWSVLPTKLDGNAILPNSELIEWICFWAPQVFRWNGKYGLAYTAGYRWAIALSDKLEGPYRKYADFPRAEGSHPRIDPCIFFDEGGKVYAYWSDISFPGIAGVELSADLKQFVGKPVCCVKRDKPWELKPLEPKYEALNAKYREEYAKEGKVFTERYGTSPTTAEGPSVIKRHGKYVLFYSTNDYRSPDYSVCAAVADSPLGPWKKLQEYPVLSREESGLNGTGHGDVVFDGEGRMWYVFHAHNSSIRISPRRTGIIRLEETLAPDGYPRYKAIPRTMRLF